MMTPHVLVVGAGPAGLAAAVSAARGGAQVRLIDGSDSTGGQYWRHLPPERPSDNERALHAHWDRYRDLVAQVERLGIQLSTETRVWAIDHDGGARPRVHLATGRSDAEAATEVVRPDALVLAPGAYDRALPLPGWTVPGVVTAGAAQALAKGERVAIGEEVVVSGTGPFLLPVAASLIDAGSQVVGIFEAAPARTLARHALRRPWELPGLSGKARELGGYVVQQLRAQVPFAAGQGVVAVHGTERVEAVTVARLDSAWRAVPGTERRLECDAVCLGHGFLPRLELPLAAGCALNAERFVEVDRAQRTSAPGVLAAGEITGIGGSDLALAEGQIAGWVAAGGAETDRSLRRARRDRSRFAGLARRLAQAYPIGAQWSSWLDDDTVVCRCEDVDLGSLRRVTTQTGSEGMRSLRLTTRAGLGRCQGRVCGRTVEELLGSMTTLRDDADPDRRPITAPIRLGDLAQDQRPRDEPGA